MLDSFSWLAGWICITGLIFAICLASLRDFSIFKEKPGVLSPGSVWVCFFDEYMYTAPTFLKLVYVMFREWKQERHQIG